MESLTKELRCRKSALKPIQISKRNNITNHNGTDDDDGIASDEGEPLSPAARLFHEPNFNIYTIAILAFKNPIDVPVVYDKLPQTLLKHPRFSS
ncbi:hypothetical protein Hanom_Chr09g00861641 [Helianthus anomalus]